MRNNIVMGNWKMNGGLHHINSLMQDLISLLPEQLHLDCVVLPPSIYIPHVNQLINQSVVHLGAQNVYPQDFGAYTGELSAPMLLDYNCRYVLVGHSERRSLFNEDEKFVAEKFHHVKDHGMIPVLCIGETLAEREQGVTQDVLAKQLLAVTHAGRDCFTNCVIAYEPVWAIGTGKTATPEQVQAVHVYIRDLIATVDKNNAQRLPILYGGSVNEHNARALFSMPDVDGGLIGGASLNARQFVEIVKCIN